MKKLDLGALSVDSFATSAPTAGARGTVAAYAIAAQTLSGCPVSWNGTCYISCNCTPACP